MSKGALAKRTRNEFKPVGFNQASARVLGDKLYGLKRQQLETGRKLRSGCGAPSPQPCCRSVAPRSVAMLPSLTKHLGVLHASLLQGSEAVWFECYPCKSKRCSIAYPALKQKHGVCLEGNTSRNIYYANVSRDCSKKLEEAFHRRLLIC